MYAFNDAMAMKTIDNIYTAKISVISTIVDMKIKKISKLDKSITLCLHRVIW